jgi:hypothetical protein
MLQINAEYFALLSKRYSMSAVAQRKLCLFALESLHLLQPLFRYPGGRRKKKQRRIVRNVPSATCRL